MLDGKDILATRNSTDPNAKLSEVTKEVTRRSSRIAMHSRTSLGINIGNAMSTKLIGIDNPLRAYSQSELTMDQKTHFAAKAGNTYTLEVYASVFVSPEVDAPYKAAKLLTFLTARSGWDKVFDLHRQAWAKNWTSQINLEGDDVAKDQLEIRAAMYNLLQSFSPSGESVCLGPLGTSGLAEHGLVSWDADYWAWTPLAFMHRSHAQSLINYRFRLRTEAFKNAESSRNIGLHWPWLSGYSGQEMATADLREQLHVGGWVALMHWNYYLLNKDISWLADVGYPTLKSTSDFWTSRLQFDESIKKYVLPSVVSPHATKARVNNCGLTLGLVKRNLTDAIAAARLLNVDANPKWQYVLDNLYMPVDPQKQIYLTFDGFKAETTNSPAVLMNFFPLELTASDTFAQIGLAFYSSLYRKTAPATGFATLGILECQYGNPATAWKLFQENIEAGSNGPFRIWTDSEQLAGDGYSIKNAGAFAQHILFGFAGVRIRSDGIHLNPAIPKNWSGIQLTGIELGNGIYDIKIDSENRVTVELVSGTADVAIFDREGKRLNLFWN